jgi:hypothetical protein
LWYTVSFAPDDPHLTSLYICFDILSNIQTLAGIRCGLGLYLDEIDLPKEVALERSRLLLWLQELIYGFSLAFSKLAVLGFYWRMFKMSTIKWPIQGLAVATVVWLILRVRDLALPPAPQQSPILALDPDDLHSN